MTEKESESSEEFVPRLSGTAALAASLAKREIAILILVGISLFVLAILVDGVAALDRFRILVKGVQDLGLSFIEAGLVILIIDMRASREQIEQSLSLIKKATAESKLLIAKSIEETKNAADQAQKMTREAIDSVFNSVYKKNVPTELVEHYESAVFDCKFFRRRDEFVYSLAVPNHARPEDFITIQIYRSYEMHNLTVEDLEFELSCETSLVVDTPADKMARDFVLRIDNKRVAVSPGEVVECAGYQALMFTHRVLIPARSCRSFELRWQAVRRVRDTEILITSWPSDGVTVSVNSPATLEVLANALHPTSLDQMSTSATSCKWSLASGMVPGQGIMVFWEPKPVSTLIGA